MKMDNEQQKGGWAMCARGGNRPSISVFLLMTTLLFLSHIHTAQSTISCQLSKSDGTPTGLKAIPATNVKEAMSKGKEKRKSCFVVYTIAGQTPSLGQWNLMPYTYVAGGFDSTTNQNDFMIKVCKDRESGCKIERTTSTGVANTGIWRLDFACCCNTTETSQGVTCNNLLFHRDMDPRPHYEKMLNDTQQQICQLEYAHGSKLDGCTRLTNQNESSDTPSICWSKRTTKGDELGCAHNDADGDRCAWAMPPKMPTMLPKSGVCQRNTNGDVECCCNGAFCNGENYMDLTCRAAITDKGDDFTYGPPQCAGARPPPTTTMSTPNGEMSSNGPVNPADTTAGEDATTATAGSNMGLIIGVSVGVVVLLLLLLAVAVGLFCWWKKRRESKKVEDPEEASALGANVMSELSGVTNRVDRRTESEREEDNYQPRDLINPAEKADELRRLGHQAAGTSVTINPNEGSDFGDHTEARGGVFDDDSEAAPTTTDKATTKQSNKDMTTNSKATNKSNQKSQTAANDKKKG